MATPKTLASSSKWNLLRILWAALFGSTFMYLVVLFVVVPPHDAPPQMVMAVALGMTAIGSAVASLLVPRFLFSATLKRAVDRGTLKTRRVPDPTGSAMFGSEAPTIQVLDDDEQTASRLIVMYRPLFLVGLALAESVFLYGLTLGFLGFDLKIVLPFFVFSWLLLAVQFPRPAALVTLVEKAGARFDPSAVHQ